MGVPKNKGDERLFITIEGWRYDITNFVARHPGGGVIRYYKDMDASDAFHAFHFRSEKASKMLATVSREKVEEPDDGKNSALVRDFRQLRETLEKEGAFDPMPFTQIVRTLEVIMWNLIAIWLCCHGYWFYGGLFRAFYMGRNGFIMHEMGHRAFTGNIIVDKVCQWISFCLWASGSPCFWNNQHNKHHAATQELKHDADLETLPLLAFCKDIAIKGHPFMMRIQWLTFLPFQLLVFPLWKLTHTRYVYRTLNYYEMLGIVLHHLLEYWAVSSQGLLGYLTFWWIGVCFGGLYLTTVFSLNHTHKPVVPQHSQRDWVTRAALYTTNLTPTFFSTWITGYLAYQIEHHLFPQIPHPRLGEVAPRVKALFAKHNVPYDIKDMNATFIAVFQNLYNVGHSVLKDN